MCSPHKLKGNGDAVRLLTPSALRQVGVKRRWNRHDVIELDYPDNPDDEGIDCQHGCNGNCYRDGSDRCNFTCHPDRFALPVRGV